MAITIIHKDLKAYFGNEDHLELAQQVSFAEMIFRLLSERAPTSEELAAFELILNLTIDHGPEAPSAARTIDEAKDGEPIGEAVAGGIEQINDTHGGAMEPAMEIFYRVKRKGESIKEIVKEYLAAEKRLPGYGHRLYKDVDPRAQLILSRLTSLEGKEFAQIAKDVEKELNTQTGKQLPLNIDGAIAATLCSFGWEPRLGKAVFICARTPGLCGHYLNNAKK